MLYYPYVSYAEDYVYHFQSGLVRDGAGGADDFGTD
jgi:hypothetical protein